MLNVRGQVHEHPGFPAHTTGAAAAEEAFLAGALLQLATGESPGDMMGYACAMQSLATAGRMEFSYEPAMIHELHLKI
jgi:sugar/nucleoside kinase (ribokinase family)